MVVSYGNGRQQKQPCKKCRKLLAVLITMGMDWCRAGHITQWSTSRASLEATRCCHWVSVCTILPWQLTLPWFLWKTQVDQSWKSWELWAGEGIGLFVYLYCICTKILMLKKLEYRMKIHKTASEQLFSGSFTLFFCISGNLFKFPIYHSLTYRTILSFRVVKCCTQ